MKMFALLISALFGLLEQVRDGLRYGPTTALANDGALTAGRHNGGLITGYAAAASTVRYLLYTQNTGGDNQYKVVAAQGDLPIGICQDEPAAATDEVSFVLLGAADATRLGVAAGAIAAGVLVLSNGDGKLKTRTGAATGSWWIVGISVTSAAANNDQIEFQPCVPQLLVVP